jgi:Tfp pilus assembly protein PilV
LKYQQSGFTIIEAMIAFAILSIGLLASVKMMTNTAVGSQIARQRMEAMNYASNRLEILRAAGLCTALPATLQTKGAQATTQYTVQVTCAGNIATVTVTWNDSRGGQAQVGGADNRVIFDSQI